MIIKNIESDFIPAFYGVLPREKKPVSLSIMIKDKFIGCFLYISGDWYVIMRLFGKTLNTGVLAATATNEVYYKLVDGISLDFNVKTPTDETGRIILKQDSYTEVKDNFILKSSRNTSFIKLNEKCYKVVENGTEMFNVLQQFRQEKIIAEFAKEVAVNIVADAAFDGVEDLIFN